MTVAHIAGVPIEEFLTLALASGAVVFAAFRAKLSPRGARWRRGLVEPDIEAGVRARPITGQPPDDSRVDNP